MMKFMNKFLARLNAHGGGKEKRGRHSEAAVEYQGFDIQPTPNKVSGGWSTEAVISKVIDGETKTHHFIRADTTASQKGAVELTISKARTMIDQAGEQIFSK
ncbi:HlyU family transcriptional regulator [Candidatus Spongiihabitans sp.]|uniref:HlyU family transcriptional regulator n=1 Tax=Candidatus Spongiihabitans sp. TaxID=3101308 RepID=UPI003C6F07DE